MLILALSLRRRQQTADTAIWLRTHLPEDLDLPLLMSAGTYELLREIPSTLAVDDVWDPAAWINSIEYAATHPGD